MKSGLTLIELLLVIGLMAIIGATAIPVGSGFLIRTSQRNKTNELVSFLRAAQLNTLTGKQNTQWGVTVSSGEIKLYASGQSAFDQTMSVPSSISITNQTVLFSPLTANPGAPATFVVSDAIGDSNSIVINALGGIDVQ